jgi:hypothetical protein
MTSDETLLPHDEGPVDWALSSPSASEQAIMEVVERNLEAMRSGDVASLERNVSDNFLGIGPSGFLLTKQEWLDGHSPSKLEYLDLRLQDKKVRTYGSGVAIFTARRISSARIQGQVVEGDFRVTEIFVNQGGRWLLANLQLSPIIMKS